MVSRSRCLSLSSAATSSYLTIGPATICGNRVTNAANVIGFFWTSMFPRYRSMVYDMDWKVKKLIPIGSSVVGAPKLVWKMLLIFSTMKLLYLKKPNNERFMTTDTMSASFLVVLFPPNL